MSARSRTLSVISILSLLVLALSACSAAKDGGTIAVRLEYPQEAGAAAPSGGTVSSSPRPFYPKAPGNRILIRVLAPHIGTPMEAWFDRSAGRGEIAGVPPGDRIAVEVDEYDNTATTLLGRGWYQGIALLPGQYREVPVAMYDRGTIVRICGAAPDNVTGNGTPGDTGDGGLATAALLNNPLSVKVGPGDEVFVSSTLYKRIRKIDRYGYVSNYAGNGTRGTLTEGEPAATAPIGAVYDMDIGPSGDLFLITSDQLIVKVDRTTGLISVKYNLPRGEGESPSGKPDLAVASDNEIYYTNGDDAKVYLVQSGARSDYVWDNGTSSLAEGAFKNTYPLIYPASITYNSAIPNLYFADFYNNRIKSMTLGPMGRIYTKVGGGISFSEGIDPLLVPLVFPYFCEYEFTYRNFYYRERDFHRVRVVRPGNITYTFAGMATAGYSGDGLAAASAALNNPSAVAVDSRGNVYIADTGNHALRMVIGGALP